MNEYCVQRLEVYRRDFFVAAENPEHARQKVVESTAGVGGVLHFDHELYNEDWPVFLVPSAEHRASVEHRTSPENKWE